jgi:hypothetical protein
MRATQRGWVPRGAVGAIPLGCPVLRDIWGPRGDPRVPTRYEITTSDGGPDRTQTCGWGAATLPKKFPVPRQLSCFHCPR